MESAIQVGNRVRLWCPWRERALRGGKLTICPTRHTSTRFRDLNCRIHRTGRAHPRDGYGNPPGKSGVNCHIHRTGRAHPRDGYGNPSGKSSVPLVPTGGSERCVAAICPTRHTSTCFRLESGNPSRGWRQHGAASYGGDCLAGGQGGRRRGSTAANWSVDPVGVHLKIGPLSLSAPCRSSPKAGKSAHEVGCAGWLRSG